MEKCETAKSAGCTVLDSVVDHLDHVNERFQSKRRMQVNAAVPFASCSKVEDVFK